MERKFPSSTVRQIKEENFISRHAFFPCVCFSLTDTSLGNRRISGKRNTLVAENSKWKKEE